MAFRRSIPGLLAPVFLFGAGAASIAAWRGGLYASFVLSLLMAAWLAALMFWRREPAAGSSGDAREIGEDKMQGALLRAALEQMPAALIAIGGDGRVRALNRVARDLFGTGDVVLDPPSGLVGGAPRVTLMGRTYRIDRIEGSRASRMRTIAVLVDIENEERMAEARAIRELLDVLSHEVMNAITPVASLAESALSMLDEDPVPTSSLRDVVGTLGRRTGGLLGFTTAYRELARLPEPVLAQVSLDSVFADLSRTFAARWPCSVALRQTVTAGLYVEADRNQLEQALWALLQNAAEAALGCSDEPCVTLVAQGGSTVTIEIADNGPGIAPALRERVFRPFVTTKPEGTGVGLSLAQQIVLGHGGTLKLKQQEAGGARFEVRLSGGAARD